MKTKLLRVTSLPALLLILLLARSALGAGLTVSPAIITNDLSGKITLTISSLSAGKTVLVEKIADFNSNGVVEAGEYLLQSFTVTDGQSALIGGVRNLNVPGDEDGAANGQIRAELFYPGPDRTLDQFGGGFIYRVSDPAPGGFASVTQRFTVRQKSYPQGVRGRITSADSGLALANVAVVLVLPNGPGGVGALANANGEFTIASPPGDYVVIALKTGFISDQAAGMATVVSNQFVTNNLALTTASLAVQGKLSDASSGAGIGGVFIFADSENAFAGVPTDSSGNYFFQVTPGPWRIRPNDGQPALQGYVGLRERIETNITANVSNLDFALPKAEALFYGTLTDEMSRRLNDVEIEAEDQGDQYRASGRTFNTSAGYSYSVAVLAGSWQVGPSEDDLALLGYLTQGTNVTINAGQALRLDFTAQLPTACIAGRLMDESGAPVANIHVNACPQNQSGGNCPSTDTGPDGSFFIGVGGGDWSVCFSSEDLLQRGLVGPCLFLSLTNGQCESNLLAVARQTNALILVSITNTDGAPVSGVNVFAYAAIDGTNYNANADTATDGSATLGVINGNWNVNLPCYDLEQRGYLCPDGQFKMVSGANQSANFVVQRPPTPARVQFSGANYVTNENSGVALITVVRSGDSNGTAMVEYSTTAGTATEGEDYTNSFGVLVFGPGVASQSFEVPIRDDSAPEAPETVALTLLNPGDGTELGSPSSATLTILDDDAPPGPPVRWYAAGKSMRLQQSGPGTPTTNGVENPFQFGALVKESFPGSVTNATMRSPSGTNYTLFPSDAESQFNVGLEFPTKSALDAVFRTGTYTFTVLDWTGGVQTLTVNLPADAYPNAPHVSNWTAAQMVEAGADFVVTWDPFSGGTAEDFVQLGIEDNMGGEWQTPEFMDPGALNGTNTSATIPAGTLMSGRTYGARLSFIRAGTLNTNGHPDIPGVPAYFKQTEFDITTTTPPPPEGRFIFSSAVFTAYESNALAEFTVLRVGGSSGDVSVDAAITGGTATMNDDYDPPIQTLEFADGQTNLTVSFALVNDSIFEEPETILLELRDATAGADIGSLSNAVLRIIDNDPRPDPTPPSVTIVAPAAGSRVTNSTVKVQGTARDNFAVVAVEYRVENAQGTGEYQAAMSTNNWANWMATVTGLAPGTNVVRVRARDDADNLSTEATRVIIYVAVDRLTLLTNGTGRIVPNLDGRFLPVGLPQTITAVPGAGFVFSNWTGGLTSSAARLTFLMASNLVLQANFVPNPFTSIKGAYNGLFYDISSGTLQHESSGFFTLRLTERGSYSGQMQLAGKRRPFSGQTDLEGNATNAVRRPGTNALQMELAFDLSGGTDRVTNRIVDPVAGWTAVLMGDRAPVFAGTNTSPFKGKYTLIVPGSEDAAASPGGDGFGTVLVGANGKLTFHGMLADGTPATQSVPLSKNGCWPLYVALYGGKGSILSWAMLNTDPAPSASISGGLSWIKPALPTARYYPEGFNVWPELAGSTYEPPGTNRVLDLPDVAEVDFRGGNLSEQFTNLVTLGANNRITNLTSNQPLVFSIVLPDGRFNGRVTLTNDGVRTILPFKGALLRHQNFGSGFFLGTNQSGRVHIGSP